MLVLGLPSTVLFRALLSIWYGKHDEIERFRWLKLSEGDCPGDFSLSSTASYTRDAIGALAPTLPHNGQSRASERHQLTGLSRRTAHSGQAYPFRAGARYGCL